MDNKIKKVDKSEILHLLFYCLLAILTYTISNNTIKIILFSFIFYSALILKKVNTSLLLFVISIAMNFEAGGLLAIVVTLPAYITQSTFKNIKKREILFVIILILIVLFSFAIGVNTQFKTLLLFMRCILLFITISKSEISEDKFRNYVFFQFLVVGVVLLLQLKNGSISIYWGRLALNDNVRELANLIAIPTLISGTSLLLENKRLLYKIVNLLILGICLFIAFATSSRGMLVSVAISIFVFFMTNKTKFPIKKIFIVLVVLVVSIFVINYISSLGIFKIDRIFVDETGGLNGRTGIWLRYLEEEFSSIRTMFFGFGPGELKRLGISTFYAHSLFLDWLFSFGLFGITYLIMALIKFFISLLKSKNKISLSIFALSCFLFSTHGIITDTLFYILLGISYSILKTNEKEIREERALMNENSI